MVSGRSDLALGLGLDIKVRDGVRCKGRRRSKRIGV